MVSKEVGCLGRAVENKLNQPLRAQVCIYRLLARTNCEFHHTNAWCHWNNPSASPMLNIIQGPLAQIANDHCHKPTYNNNNHKTSNCPVVGARNFRTQWGRNQIDLEGMPANRQQRLLHAVYQLSPLQFYLNIAPIYVHNTHKNAIKCHQLHECSFWQPQTRKFFNFWVCFGFIIESGFRSRTGYIGMHTVVCLLLALEATELVSEPVTEMALELINNHLISVQSKSYILFHVTITTNKF